MLQDNMEDIGWEIISVSTNKTKNNACICAESSCGQLSRWFAALNDARGCKLVMPAIGGTNNPERKQFKIERCCHHQLIIEKKPTRQLKHATTKAILPNNG